MKKINIKIKMALWYGLLTTILMVIFLPLLYTLESSYIYDGLKTEAQSNAESIASDLGIGNIDKNVLKEDTLKHYKIPSGVIATIIDENGKVVLSNNNLYWNNELPYRNNTIWHKTYHSKEWMVYDKAVKLISNKAVTIRICISQKPTENTLWNIYIAMIIGGFCFVAFATIGGVIIASKALKPISMITKTAKDIEKGDLSRRIQGIESKDEVGTLVETFNSMLEHLETSFKREKQFASDASHELRTPIAIIMNTSQQLIESEKNIGSNISDECMAILQESIHMEKIISQLLTLTRGYEGKYKLNAEIIEIGEIIFGVIDQLEDYAKKYQVNVTFSNPNNIYLNADQTMLTQLFLNLIQNAIKYSITGGCVSIEIHEMEDTIITKITDNGIGIAPEDLPHIFDRFYRADKARDRTGTGLGLSIVKWIVDIHHGEIEVSSKLGEGTVFSLIFPKKLRSK